MVWRRARFAAAWCGVAVWLLLGCGGKSSGEQGSGGGGTSGTQASGGGGTSGTQASGGGGTSGSQEPVSCEQTSSFYAQLLDAAKGCDPHGPNPCTLRVSDALGCGCETFVDPSSWDASLAMAFATHYSVLECNANGNCGPCRVPVRGTCSIMDGCQDAYDAPPGRACKVNGTIYADGTPGIPDPISCNTCTCMDGALSCTEVDCPKPCPAGTTFARSCAQCGPTMECDVVELACRPACTGTCAEGDCIDGVCIAPCIE